MKRLLTVLICVSMLLVLFSACAQNQQQQPNQQNKQPTAAPTTAATGGEGITELTLPLIKEPVTLSVWAGLSARAAASIKNYDEMIAYQELSKRTGITLKFIHPPVGQEKEQFNLMLASK
jgi:putative aldouronate transport system substrate-binding protein